MEQNAADIHGHVLEIASSRYATEFGANVTAIDVLMAGEGNPDATIVGDLTNAPQIPDRQFDCAIVTQTLQFIFDTRAAIETLHRTLTADGVLLVTAPGITKISSTEDETWGEWWHFTARSLHRLVEERFGEGNVEVTSFGNVLTAAGFLFGLASEDLSEGELNYRDPQYEVIIGIRAIKRVAPAVSNS